MQDESARLIACLPRLRRYAQALTGERGAADELVRDTMERGWRKLPAWRPGSDMQVWLLGILHQVQAEQVRRAHADGAALPEQPALAVAAARATDNLAMRDMHAALAVLPVEQRAIVLLVALEEMTYEEVAATLGIPLGAVLSRLSRARECLRKLMLGQRVASPLKVVK